MNYSTLFGIERSHVRYEREFWKSIVLFLRETEREASGIAHSSFLLERHKVKVLVC